MLRKAGIAVALMLSLPSFASAWTVTAKIGSGAGTVSDGTSTVTKLATGSAVTGYFKTVDNTVPSQSLAVAAGAGYKVSSVVIDGVAQSGNGPYTINAGTPAKNHTMVVYYTAVTSSVTVSQSAGGSVTVQLVDGTGKALSPVSRTGLSGLKSTSLVKIVAAPNSDYAVTAVAGNAVAGGQGESQSVTLPVSGIAGAISASFGLVPSVAARISAGSAVTSLNGYAGATPKATYSTTDLVPLDITKTTGNGAVTPTLEALSVDANGNKTAYAAASFTGTTGVTFPDPGTYVVKLTAAVGTASSVAYTPVITVVNASVQANQACTSCHATRNAASMTAYAAGTHGGTSNSNSYTCVTCHKPAAGHPYAVAADAKKVQKGDSFHKEDGKNVGDEGFVGSDACAKCHTDKFNTWSKTLHNQPLKQLSETGLGVLVNKGLGGENDFFSGLNFNNYSGNGVTGHTVLVDKYGKKYANPFGARYPNAPILGMKDGVPSITIGSVTYPISRAHGGNGKWKQRYQTKIGNAYYVLNVMWNEGNGRYAEYNGQNWYGYPDAAQAKWIVNNKPIFSNNSGALLDQVKTKIMKAYGKGLEGGPSNSSWDLRCTGCHQTGMKLNFLGDATKGEVAASYAELNVGCEACHGPGAQHIAAPTAANITQPEKAFVTAESANYYRADEVCGQCHVRTEGAGHLGVDGSSLVNLPTESPSRESFAGYSTVGYRVGERLNEFVEKYDPGVWGTVDNTDAGATAYDGEKIPTFYASNKHHQTFSEIQMGKHGAAKQMAGNPKGLSCWSCHDPHAANSSNIKSSINGVATSKDDNSLCFACHNATSNDASNADFAGLSKADIGNAEAERTIINAHLGTKLGYTNGLTSAEYKASVGKDVTSFGVNGTGAFGVNTIKAGNCVSCHMPLTVVSGFLRDPSTGLTAGANVRGVGDVHLHTMKTVKAAKVAGKVTVGNVKLNGKAGGAPSADGTPASANTGVMTSCTVCHTTGAAATW